MALRCRLPQDRGWFGTGKSLSFVRLLAVRDDLFDQTEALQNLLISHATGGSEDDAEYVRLRQMVLANGALDALVPRFLRTSRNLSQFWQFIKFKFPTYAERRNYIWQEFNPMLELLERGGIAPADHIVAQTLQKFDAAHVQAAWSKALERRSSDAEGAITSARTLIEAVCKHWAAPDFPDTSDCYKAAACSSSNRIGLR